jgi:LytS/YehU family sensor histidine kinase
MKLERNTLNFIRAVLSSHATFNALSAIQNFIASDEKRSSLVSLSGFARFIRRLSSSAEIDSIPVGEDLAFLESYLEMEALRFGDDIQFDINIDATAKESTEKITSFVLQPCIEKMLLMGLRGGNRNFALRANIFIENGDLVSEISINKTIPEDILSKLSPEQMNRVSLLKERIELMQSELKRKIQVEENNSDKEYVMNIRIPFN